jgi:hypothetical protein
MMGRTCRRETGHRHGGQGGIMELIKEGWRDGRVEKAA